MQALENLRVGQRLYASNGNASDISIFEIVRYYGDDPETRVIILYTEGFAHPREFMETALRLAAGKPVLAMKAERTEQGAKAASSYTGFPAGVDIATEQIFEKTGIFSFSDEGKMVGATMAFSSQSLWRSGPAASTSSCLTFSNTPRNGPRRSLR